MRIAGDVVGGPGNISGHISGNGLGNVQIGGDVVGGAGNSTGAVDANQGIGHVRIGSDLIGGSIADSDSLSNSGMVRSSSGRIASVTIGGSLIAGTDASTGTLDLCGAIVAGSDLGPVKIGGSIFGNRENPVLIAADGQAVKPPTGFDIAIASITIRGNVTGSLSAGDHFGFVAQQIGSFKSFGFTAPLLLATAAQNIALPFTDDVRILEV